MHRLALQSTFAMTLAASLLLPVVPAVVPAAKSAVHTAESALPAIGLASGSVGPAGVAPTHQIGSPSPLRLLVMPLRVTGGSIPSPAALASMLRREVSWLRRASYGKVPVEGRIAPAFDARPYEYKYRLVSSDGRQAALANAEANGFPLDGAVPIFVLSYPHTTDLSSGDPSAVEMRSQMWKVPGYVAHEFGHALGLMHAKTPQCGQPLRPARCREHGPRVAEYGDSFDIMGFSFGADVFGAVELGQLGWAPLTDAPPGRATIAVRPVNRRAPTILRLRAAHRDWYIETRTRGWNDNTGGFVRSPRGVLVARVQPYSSAAFTDPDGLLRPQPSPYRIPANDKRFCGASDGCFDRFLYRPGSRLTVPGVFTMRVLPGSGATRVRTRWLDRVPPTVSVVGATIHRFVGADPQLVVHLSASASGAGVLKVTIDQGGVIARIKADDVTGLVDGASASGNVTVPLVAGAPMARIRLIDAAGNVSRPADVNLASLASELHPRVVFDPPIARSEAQARAVPAGGLTVTGTTDPSLAGTAWRFNDQEAGIVAPDGSFSGVVHPANRGINQVDVKVPVGRQPGGLLLNYEHFLGMVRT